MLSFRRLKFRNFGIVSAKQLHFLDCSSATIEETV